MLKKETKRQRQIFYFMRFLQFCEKQSKLHYSVVSRNICSSNNFNVFCMTLSGSHIILIETLFQFIQILTQHFSQAGVWTLAEPLQQLNSFLCQPYCCGFAAVCETTAVFFMQFWAIIAVLNLYVCILPLHLTQILL